MGGRYVLSIGLALVASAGLARAQPANDDCADATVIGSLPFTDTVDTSAATTEAGDPVIDCDQQSFGQSTKSVWYRFTAPSGANLDIDTHGSDFDTVLVAWKGACGALTDTAVCNADDYDDQFFDDQSRAILSLAPGESVYIEIVNDDGAGDSLVFNAKASPVFQVSPQPHDGSTGYRPDVASGADGTFLVVYQDGDTDHVVGRRYCDGGIPLGPTFAITEEPAYGREPRVIRNDDEYVVVWVDFVSTPGGVRGRRVSASGTPIGSEFEVTTDQSSRYSIDLAALGDGDFVVAWDQTGNDGDGDGVFARRFDASGAPLGAPFQVNTYTTSDQQDPAVDADADGNFVVVWQSGSTSGGDPVQDGDGFGVFAQRFTSTAAPVGSEFQVNETTTSRQGYPAVAVDPAGNFVVAWSDTYTTGCNDYCLMARRYDDTGAALGSEFRVAEPATGYGYNGGGNGYGHGYGDVDNAPDGRFVVAWRKDYVGPFARTFDAAGAPASDSTMQSHIEDGYAYNAMVGVADDGDFVVVWDWAPLAEYRVMGRATTQSSSCPGPPPGCPAAPLLGCREPTIDLKGTLILKDKTPDTGDSFGWKWLRGEEIALAALGDPLATTSHRACVWDGASAVVFDAQIPPGGTCGTNACWKSLGANGFKYIDKAATQAGIQKVVLKPGAAGSAKAIVKGKGIGLAMPDLPLAMRVTAQLIASSGECWTATFETGGLKTNVDAEFSGKASAGTP